jgi:energy-coupling factor transporter ATP-binding protein EcfA2
MPAIEGNFTMIQPDQSQPDQSQPNRGRAIVARSIVKEFETEIGTRRVLDGISFHVGMGERMAVLGRNGAGKSTLIQILSGLQTPTSECQPVPAMLPLNLDHGILAVACSTAGVLSQLPGFNQCHAWKCAEPATDALASDGHPNDPVLAAALADDEPQTSSVFQNARLCDLQNLQCGEPVATADSTGALHGTLVSNALSVPYKLALG